MRLAREEGEPVAKVSANPIPKNRMDESPALLSAGLFYRRVIRGLRKAIDFRKILESFPSARERKRPPRWVGGATVHQVTGNGPGIMNYRWDGMGRAWKTIGEIGSTERRRGGVIARDSIILGGSNPSLGAMRKITPTRGLFALQRAKNRPATWARLRRSRDQIQRRSDRSRPKPVLLVPAVVSYRPDSSARDERTEEPS